MREDIKKVWLEALPNYNQGKNQLKCEDGSMCCLGVLREEMLKNKFYDEDMTIVNDHQSVMYLTEKEAKFIELNDDTGIFIPDDEDKEKHFTRNPSVKSGYSGISPDGQTTISWINDYFPNDNFKTVSYFIEKYF